MPPVCASTGRWSVVKVERKLMVVRPARGTPDAVSGPTANTIFDSGANGSVPAGTSS